MGAGGPASKQTEQAGKWNGMGMGYEKDDANNVGRDDWFMSGETWIAEFEASVYGSINWFYLGRHTSVRSNGMAWHGMARSEAMFD